MTTFEKFTDSVALMLDGFSTAVQQQTHLLYLTNDTVTTFQVDDASVIPAPCMVEVDSELMWVTVADTITDNLTIAPYGRGYRGTTAASHEANARLVVAPVVPRAMIEQAINDTIRSTFPTLFGVGTEDLVADNIIDTFAMPADCERILSVSWSAPGPSKEWLPVRRYTYNVLADTTDFPTGRSISIHDPVMPGRGIRVVYAKVPAALAAGDVFTDSGLRDAAQDLIRFGAASRLAPWFEMAQVPGIAAEPNYAAAMGQNRSGSATARYLTQMFQLRLAEEAGALNSLYPTRSHYTR